MKVVEESERRLVIEDRPWVLGLLMIGFAVGSLWGAFDEAAGGAYGVALLLFGLAALLVWVLNRFIALGRLELDAATREATWRQVSATRQTHLNWPLHALRRAVVETKRDDGETHRITLLFDDGHKPLPLTPYFTSFGRHEEIKDRINRFLDTSRD